MMASMSDNECVDENVTSDDGIAESGGDSKGDGKKRKFKPLQAVRKLFNRTSRRRSKSKDRSIDPVSYKSKSTTALSDVQSDEENGTGFRKLNLSGSRSISEDSIFSTEQKEPNLDALKKLAVSDEALNQRALNDELYGKLKSRQSCSSDDEDEGLALSPKTKLTTADIIMAGSMKPLREKTMSKDHERSLQSVDGSDTEGDTFESSWDSKVAGVTSRQSPTKDSKMDLDLDAIKVEHAPIISESAKHKLSVRPKSRKMTKKTHKEKAATAPLPRLSEEANSKTSPEIKTAITSDDNPLEAEVKKATDIMDSPVIIIKPAETGSPEVPHSDPVDIPSTKPTMRHGLSSSPLNQSILDEMKVKRRQTSTKAIEDLENRKSTISPEGQENTEFSQMLTKMKRKSVHRKDEDKSEEVEKESKSSEKGNVNTTEKSTVSVSIDKSDSSTRKIDTTTTSSAKKSESLSSSVITAKTTTNSVLIKTDKDIPNKESSRDVTNVKEALPITKSGNSVVSTDDHPSETIAKQGDVNSGKVTLTTSQAAVSKLTVTDSQASAANKLPSPKEDYKQKRQGRSKTLPDQPVVPDAKPTVSFDTSKVQRSLSHGSDLEASNALKNKTENVSNSDNASVSSVEKKSEPRKLTDRRSMFETSESSSQPAWVKLANKKQTNEEEIEKKVSSAKKDVSVIEKKTSPTEIKTFPAKVSDVKDSASSGSVSSFSKTFTASDKGPSNISSLSKSFKQESSSSSTSHKPVKHDSISVQSVSKSVNKEAPSTVTSFSKFSGAQDTNVGKKPSVTKSPEKEVSAKETSKPSIGMKFEGSNRNSVKKNVESDSKPVGMKFDSSFKSVQKPKDFGKTLESKSDVKPVSKVSPTESKGENSTTPAWRRDLSKKKSPSEVKIEIIDKSNVDKSQPKGKDNSPEKQKVQLRDKTNVDSSKCSDTQSNRASTVLDMVKNFQKLQVTT